VSKPLGLVPEELGILALVAAIALFVSMTGAGIPDDKCTAPIARADMTSCATLENEREKGWFF
jgi:hypothetical protein